MNSKIFVCFIIAGAVSAIKHFETNALFPKTGYQEEVEPSSDFVLEGLTLDEIFVPEISEYLKVVLPHALHLIASTSEYIAYRSTYLNNTRDIIQDIHYRTDLLARLLQ